MRLFRFIFLISMTCALVSVLYAQNTTDGGLKAEIIAVSISGSRPVVTFKISDAKGNPLDITDLDPNSVKFTMAVLRKEKDGGQDYHNYILTKVAGKEYV